MTHLKVGDKAPDFKLNDGEGKVHQLADYKGKKLVIYFYPRDDTPGCTKEACDLRDNIGVVKKLGASVLGVSTDDEKSHKKFSEKFSLPFPLLADVNTKMSTDYGVYGLKKFMGREYKGITRSTFIVDGDGIIQNVFYKIKAEKNIEEVKNSLK